VRREIRFGRAFQVGGKDRRGDIGARVHRVRAITTWSLSCRNPARMSAPNRPDYSLGSIMNVGSGSNPAACSRPPEWPPSVRNEAFEISIVTCWVGWKREIPTERPVPAARDQVEPGSRPVVKPARLQPLADTPRSWPSTRPRIAFVRRPQRCRYRRCPCLAYARPRSRRERLLLIYEIPWSTLVMTNTTKSIDV
jgi:hypothetical protein